MTHYSILVTPSREVKSCRFGTLFINLKLSSLSAYKIYQRGKITLWLEPVELVNDAALRLTPGFGIKMFWNLVINFSSFSLLIGFNHIFYKSPCSSLPVTFETINKSAEFAAEGLPHSSLSHCAFLLCSRSATSRAAMFCEAVMRCTTLMPALIRLMMPLTTSSKYTQAAAQTQSKHC